MSLHRSTNPGDSGESKRNKERKRTTDHDHFGAFAYGAGTTIPTDFVNRLYAAASEADAKLLFLECKQMHAAA
jgi:hypothetical protein